MVYSQSSREKLYPYKIKGQSKPFVDGDLQLQLPGSQAEPSGDTDSCPSPIYSHYSGSYPTETPFSSLVNESGLCHAMAEAENSFQAWKKMQQRIKDAVR